MRGDNFIDAYRAAHAVVIAPDEAALRREQQLHDLALAGPLAEETGRKALGVDLSRDTFNERRANQAGAGVNYDPDSLRVGDEPVDGVRYRGEDWRDPESLWQRACRGDIPTAEIPGLFPVMQGLTY
jgi:hypothetical protein